MSRIWYNHYSLFIYGKTGTLESLAEASAEGVRQERTFPPISQAKGQGHTYANVLLFGGLMLHQLLFLLPKYMAYIYE